MRSLAIALVIGCVVHAGGHGAAASLQDPANRDEAKPPLSKALASDPRLAPLTPAVRDKVLNEADAVKQYCETNPTLGAFYECDCFARKVVDHRFKVGTDVETMGSATRPASGEFKVPFATIVADRELDSSPCVTSAEKIEAWGRARVLDPSMSETKKACIARELATRFRKKPLPDMVYVQSLMRESTQACSGR